MPSREVTDPSLPLFNTTVARGDPCNLGHEEVAGHRRLPVGDPHLQRRGLEASGGWASKQRRCPAKARCRAGSGSSTPSTEVRAVA